MPVRGVGVVPDKVFRAAVKSPSAQCKDPALQTFFSLASDWLDCGRSSEGLSSPIVILRFFMRDRPLMSVAEKIKPGKVSVGGKSLYLPQGVVHFLFLSAPTLLFSQNKTLGSTPGTILPTTAETRLEMFSFSACRELPPARRGVSIGTYHSY